MKKERYIIIDRGYGVFLGTYTDSTLTVHDDLASDVVERTKEEIVYALFAYNNVFDVNCAPVFDTVVEAIAYAMKYLNAEKYSDVEVAGLLTEDIYATLPEIIKGGFGDFTFNMLDSLLPESSLIH